jgi:hypothetical protein
MQVVWDKIECAGGEVHLLPCLNTGVLILQALALDPLQLAAHLKLARCL